MTDARWVEGMRGEYRVIRGGNWNNNLQNCRSAIRNDDNPGNRNNNVGVRLASSPRRPMERVHGSAACAPVVTRARVPRPGTGPKSYGAPAGARAGRGGRLLPSSSVLAFAVLVAMPAIADTNYSNLFTIDLRSGTQVRLEKLDDYRSPSSLDVYQGDTLSMYYRITDGTGAPLSPTSFTYRLALDGASVSADAATWASEGAGIIRLTLLADRLALGSTSHALAFPSASGAMTLNGQPAVPASVPAAITLTGHPSAVVDSWDLYLGGSAGLSGILGFQASPGVAKASLAAARLSVGGTAGAGMHLELDADRRLTIERRTELGADAGLEVPSVEVSALGGGLTGPGVRLGVEGKLTRRQGFRHAGSSLTSPQAQVVNAGAFLEALTVGGDFPYPGVGILLKAIRDLAIDADTEELLDLGKREESVGLGLGGKVTASVAQLRPPGARRNGTSYAALAPSLEAGFEGSIEVSRVFEFEPRTAGRTFIGHRNEVTLAFAGDAALMNVVPLTDALGLGFNGRFGGEVTLFGHVTPGGVADEAGVDVQVEGGAGVGLGVALFRGQDYAGEELHLRFPSGSVLNGLRSSASAQMGQLLGNGSAELSLGRAASAASIQACLTQSQSLAGAGAPAYRAYRGLRYGRVLGGEIELSVGLAAIVGADASVRLGLDYERGRRVERALEVARVDGKSWELRRNSTPASFTGPDDLVPLLQERIFDGLDRLVASRVSSLTGTLKRLLDSLFSSPADGLAAAAPAASATLSVTDPVTGRAGGRATFPDAYRGHSATLITADPSGPLAPTAGVKSRSGFVTRQVLAQAPATLTLVGNTLKVELTTAGGVVVDPFPAAVTVTLPLYADQVARMGGASRLADVRVFRFDASSVSWELVGGTVAGDQGSVSAGVTRPGTYAPGFVTVSRAGDSDGDGLLDGEEDKNGNGILDAGETDPYAWDTDGDGVSDGAERAAGTDPLDAASRPNRPPSLAVSGSRSGQVGLPLELQVSGLDADGDALTYGAQGLPPGATLEAQTGAFRFTPTAAGEWSVTFSVRDALTTTSQVVVLTAARVAADTELQQLTRVVPIVLDVPTGDTRYTTELSLANRGTATLDLTLRYQASLGEKLGSGAVTTRLLPGEQRVIPDAISYLRSQGLAIPETGSGQGGALVVKFAGASSEEEVEAVARTTAATVSPQPEGAAGLAYSGVRPLAAGASATLWGLRQNATDRSNVAVFNPGPGDVTVRVTAFSGDGSGTSRVVSDGLTVPGFGWTQINRVLDGTGITQGWVTVEKTGGSGSFGAYGVINDNGTNDGSYVVPAGGSVSGSRITVPALVETSSFRSELVLSNRSTSSATLTLRYVESLTPSLGGGGSMTVTLNPKEQRIVPEAIDFLRRNGVTIGAMNAGSYAGALRVSVSGAALADVFAGARTASPSPAGGQFGLFTPGVYAGQEASTEAYLYGLRADASNRTNAAVLNSGADTDGNATLELRVFDGDAGGVQAGGAETVTLAPGQWRQITGILGARGVRNGWVKVSRKTGIAPWVAYGVINDGASAGERTGDGSYVPMVAAAPQAPSIYLATVENGVERPLCEIQGACLNGGFTAGTGQILRAYVTVAGLPDPQPPADLAWTFGMAATPVPATGRGQGVYFTYLGSASNETITVSGYAQPTSLTGTVVYGGGPGGGPEAPLYELRDSATGAALPLLFSGSYQAQSGQSIVFRSVTRSGDLVPGVIWTFGDGGQSIANPATHTYLNLGSASRVFSGTLTAGFYVQSFRLEIELDSRPSPTGAYTFRYVDGTLVDVNLVDPSKAVRFTASEDADTYDWDFGDLTVHGSTKTVDHTFPATGGSYVVVLRETKAGGVYTTAFPATFRVPAPPEAPAWVVPGIVSSEGPGGSYWRSDLTIHNPGTSSGMSLRLAFLDASKSVTPDALKWALLVLAPGVSRSVVDVAGGGSFPEWGLGPGSRSGAILIRNESSGGGLDPVIVARTYNTGTVGSGSHGSSIPSVRTSEGLKPQSSAYQRQLIGLCETDDRYTNVGIVNLRPDDAEVEVRFFGPSGSQLGNPVLFQVGPYEIQQRNHTLRDAANYPSPAASYRAELAITKGNVVAGYAFVVDARSGDPSIVVLSPRSSTSYRIPGVVRAMGASNALFRSDVTLFNAAATPRTASMTFSYRSTTDASLTTKSWDAELPSKGLLDIRDFVKTLLNLPEDDPSSYYDSLLDVQQKDSLPDPILVTARTYSQQPSGTLGLQLGAFSSSDTASAGGARPHLTLAGLRSSSDSSSGHRSNVAVFLGPGERAAADVGVKWFDSSGVNRGSTRLGLDAGTPFVQLSDSALFGGAGWDLSNITVVIDVSGGQAAVAASATVIDNKSGDASFIPSVPTR